MFFLYYYLHVLQLQNKLMTSCTMGYAEDLSLWGGSGQPDVRMGPK